MPSSSNVARLPIEAFLERCGLAGAPARRFQSCGPLPPSLPLLDARSPEEFQHSHIPGAVNFPLFLDDERREVGTLYKREGAQQAMLRGLACIGPRMEDFARRALYLAGPDQELALYCSRGGMRSASLGWLFDLLGLRVVILEGGYKRFRNFVLEYLDRFEHTPPVRLLALGGRTGCGKTEALRRMAAQGAQALDIEGLARHRGSAFGWFKDSPQPGRAHFENLLVVALAQCDAAKPVWAENESENLGAVNLPKAFFRALKAAPLALLEVPPEDRLRRVLADYGALDYDLMALALERIRKRLGGLEHKRAREALDSGDLRALALILLDYYDRAYDKQLEGRTIVARVEAAGIAEAAEKLLHLAGKD